MQADSKEQRRIRQGTVAAGIVAALALLSAYFSPLMVLLFAAPFAAAAFGIRRGSAWAAVGAIGFLLIPILTRLLTGVERQALPALLFLLVLAVVPAFFLFRAALLLWPRRTVAAGVSWTSLLVILFAGSLLLRPMVMPSGSMENTVLVGDHMLFETASRFTGREPARGELVLFRYPVNTGTIFLKRVIGLPGDRIRIDRKKLHLNGQPAAEPYAIHKTEYFDSYRDHFPSEPTVRLFPQALEMLAKNVVNGEVVVPGGKYFVMGDNRDSSLDSRYWGFISKSDIIGRPVLIYASYDIDSATLAKEGSAPNVAHMRWNRLFRRL